MYWNRESSLSSSFMVAILPTPEGPMTNRICCLLIIALLLLRGLVHEIQMSQIPCLASKWRRVCSVGGIITGTSLRCPVAVLGEGDNLFGLLVMSLTGVSSGIPKNRNRHRAAA